MSVTIHPSAIVDQGAQIGTGSRVWHFVHVCAGARIGQGRLPPADAVRTLDVGFMPLLDAAPLLAAVRLGLDRRHGLSLRLHRQASWAVLRDRLLSGELDAAHAMAALVLGVQTGIG